MGYNAYINYLNSIGLQRAREYVYTDKQANIHNETERMINRSLMMYEWHGLPDTIPQRQLELILQLQGYAIIGMIDGKPYACYGGLGGVLDEYYRPTKAIVSIPYFNFNAEWEIGRECVIIRNDTLMQGLLPLYAKYVTLLNETEISLLLATVNQRIESTISASDKATIESAKQYLKDVYAGKQGIIADNSFLESLKVFSQRQVQGQLRELVEALHYLKAQMYNEIGLATNYNLKKERITRAEVELNTDNLYPLVDDMYYCRMQGIEEAGKLFGLEWQVELNSSWDYRAYNGEPLTTKGDSDVDDSGNPIGDIGGGADNAVDVDNGDMAINDSAQGNDDNSPDNDDNASDNSVDGDNAGGLDEAQDNGNGESVNGQDSADSDDSGDSGVDSGDNPSGQDDVGEEDDEDDE